MGTSYGMTDLYFDDMCENMSDMFKENKYKMLCTSLTAAAISKDLDGCTIPMGTVYGIARNITYLIGLHTYTSLSVGGSLCSYGYMRSYFTILGNYAGFIQYAIGREMIWSPGYVNKTLITINLNFKMVDRNFTDLDGKHSTIVGGNFFKYDANYNNIDSSNSIDNSDIDSSDSVDNSDIDSSISIDNSNIDLTADANKGSGLSQREKTILAVCISVGGAIIITFIVFYVWRRRWRNSNLADPTYQDVIETEIGGATVPADNAPALLQGTVDNEHNNVATRQGEQPPTYNDVVVERRQTLLASTEKPDMKKDDD